eukprot:gb/GECG01006925.1/.p1 GENE.gb/GECG01006925.1/~~gb/GECG01006925.1/.p1  ORF type:complete len:269 (+),score=23.37 gb/GECG01006925.1/:1-807(+)
MLGLPEGNFKFVNRSSITSANRLEQNQISVQVNPLVAGTQRKMSAGRSDDNSVAQSITGTESDQSLMVKCMDREAAMMMRSTLAPCSSDPPDLDKKRCGILLVIQGQNIDFSQMDLIGRTKLKFRLLKSTMLGELPPLVEVSKKSVQVSEDYTMECNPLAQQMRLTNSMLQSQPTLHPEASSSGENAPCRRYSTYRTEFRPSLPSNPLQLGTETNIRPSVTRLAERPKVGNDHETVDGFRKTSMRKVALKPTYSHRRFQGTKLLRKKT